MSDPSDGGYVNGAIRCALPADADTLANLWWRGWHDAHADCVPMNLVKLRTRASFDDRVRQHIERIRVVGPVGSPVGLYCVKSDEMHQLFVSAEARGTGTAASLLRDAERLLCAAGVRNAWLACAIGNSRAKRFYEKSGWTNVGQMVDPLDTSNGVFRLTTWRFEKSLLTDAL